MLDRLIFWLNSALPLKKYKGQFSWEKNLSNMSFVLHKLPLHRFGRIPLLHLHISELVLLLRAHNFTVHNTLVPR